MKDHKKNTATHGNSLDTKKPASGYTLRDRNTGEICKIGETTCGKSRYTQKYLDEEDVDMVFDGPQNVSKREIKKWENDNIKKYKEKNDGKRPRLNKSDH